MKIIDREIRLWPVALSLLTLANLAFLHHNFISWMITLSVFLLLPGYLFLKALSVSFKSIWATIALSVGLSVCIMMILGLALNVFHAFGVERPLQSISIFIILDVYCLLFVIGLRKLKFKLPLKALELSTIEKILVALFTLLPIIAIGGAIRLNNGASNIWTMVLLGMVGVLFFTLVLFHRSSKIHLYAIFMTALALLLCTSLRGWTVAGHDIHLEYSVFNTTLGTGFWRVRTGTGNPYAACLSITILPTILYRITMIEPIYIYKVVFQVIVACIIPVLYLFMRKFVSPTKAIVGIFAFISFPTFVTDLPFLNRQEIAFCCFLLLLFINFSHIKYRAKLLISVVFLVSIILSHYSTSYVSVSLLLLSFFSFQILNRIYKRDSDLSMPILRLPIIIMAFLATFVWNAQITTSTGNLSSTLVATVQGFINKDKNTSDSGRYNIASRSKASTPEQLLAQKVEDLNLPIKYAPPALIPLTPLGQLINRYTDITQANFVLHSIIAKILQLLVIVGTFVIFFRFRNKSTKTREVYLLAICVSCLAAMTLFTIFPQLSIGYDVTRLFQQSMMVLWLPLLATFQFFAWKAKRWASAITMLFLVLVFYNLSGLGPQLTGAYLPQMTLNNSGLYYDYFYTHESDIVGTKWLSENKLSYLTVYTDTNAAAPPKPYTVQTGFISGYPQGYYYTDHMNNTRGIYRSFANSGFAEYTNPAIIANKGLVYSTGDTKIYYKLVAQ